MSERSSGRFPFPFRTWLPKRVAPEREPGAEPAVAGVSPKDFRALLSTRAGLVVSMLALGSACLVLGFCAGNYQARSAAAPLGSAAAAKVAQEIEPPLAGAGAASAGSSLSQVLLAARAVEDADVQSARELCEKLAHDPALVREAQVLRRLRMFSQDARTSLLVLGCIAELPGSLAADMIYEVWTNSRRGTRPARLAEELLSTPELRAKASPGLRAIWELVHGDGERDCGETRRLLSESARYFDQRALPHLGRLARPFGCGETKHDDCYPCLRTGNELAQAQSGAQVRRAPQPFGD